MAKILMRRDLGGIRPTPIAQWTGPGEAGSKIFSNFQITNDIFFNDISNFMTFLFIDIIH
jgi:hypothetical protein